MNKEQKRREFEVWYKGKFCSRLSDRAASIALQTNSKGEYDSYHVREAWELWQAANASQAKSVPPIERDEEMQRDYIPLPANWEVQTKGKGSTFRLAKTDGSDIRWPILEKMLHEPLEQMAREIHAAWQGATASQAKIGPIGYIDREQLTRWEKLRGTEFEQEERACIGFSTKPFKTEMTDCTLAVYAAPQPDERVRELENKYNELIMAVASKFPNETRHETALRYIRNAEARAIASMPDTGGER